MHLLLPILFQGPLHPCHENLGFRDFDEAFSLKDPVHGGENLLPLGLFRLGCQQPGLLVLADISLLNSSATFAPLPNFET